MNQSKLLEISCPFTLADSYPKCQYFKKFIGPHLYDNECEYLNVDRLECLNIACVKLLILKCAANIIIEAPENMKLLERFMFLEL